MGSLRFLLALTVLLWHASGIIGMPDILKLPTGNVAVQAFFIISGFYMSLILTEKYGHESGSYKLFITNRFLRLYPAYIAVLFLTFLSYLGVFFWSGNIIGAARAWATYASSLDYGTLVLMVFSNIFIIGLDVSNLLVLTSNGVEFFTGSAHTHLLMNCEWFRFIIPAWSIATELTFYLIAPFMVRKSVLFKIMVVLLSSIGRYYSYLHIDILWTWEHSFFFFELAFFMGGSLAYDLYAYIKKHGLWRTIPGKTILLSAILIIYCLTIFFGHLGLNKWIYLSIFAFLVPFVFLFTRNNKTDRFIGNLSYPMYLSHWVIIEVLSEVRAYNPYNIVLAILSTVCLSVLIYLFIERRVDAYRQKRVETAIKTAGIKLEGQPA